MRRRAVAEAADRFLECSVADLSAYAERRRDLLTAIARLGQVGLLLVLLFGQGCVSLAPEADRVRFTKNRADVDQCEMLGTVEGIGRGGLICAEPCKVALRNRAAALGADTVLFTGGGTGMAYRCGKS